MESKKDYFSIQHLPQAV